MKPDYDENEDMMQSESPKMCTTSGRPVDVVRAEQTETTGQHKDYIVLCDKKRAKGFVRPYRDKYIHSGRSICAKTRYVKPGMLGGPRDVCALPFDHEGECEGPTYNVTQAEQSRLLESHRKGGCGTETIMGRALSETYARDPSFYGATFCCQCNRHLPVGEFVWSADSETVGS